MEVLGEYYNFHVRFLHRPSAWTQQDVVKATMNLGRAVKAIKKNNLEMKKEFRAETKRKKAAIAAKKEEKKLRKENGHNNQSNSTDV